MARIILVTGGFDPLHLGHIAYFEAAKKLGDTLVVGINSDDWLTRKKGRPFMRWEDRAAVVKNIKYVDHIVRFNDSDNSAKDAIHKVRLNYPSDKIIFANGGDRTANNIPEMDIKDSNLEFVFAVGGDDKKNSSSWILEEWRAPKTGRPWGYYSVLHENKNEVKLKELTVDSGACLSMQRHQHRSEFWFVAEGEASVYTLEDNEVVHKGHYKKFDSLFIDSNQWHRLCNETEKPLKIIEIQYGSNCVEEDIERK